MVDLNNLSEKESKGVVTADELNAECHRLRYIHLLDRAEVFPSESNWEFIIANKMEGLGRLLLRKYMVSWLMPEDKRSVYHTQALRLFPDYLRAVRREYALDVVYSDPHSSADAFQTLIKDCQLFDARRLAALLESHGEVDLVVETLDAFQPQYTLSDAREMRNLLNRLHSLPKIGRLERRQGLFSNEVRYYCPAGHSNPSDSHFCSREDCRLNICGLTPEQVKKIDDFEMRIKALDSLLKG